MEGCPILVFIRRGSGVTSITVFTDTANMKTCTLLVHPLLMVGMLAVSLAAGVTLQDTHRLQDTYLEEQLQAYLETNPSVLLDLYPDLLREASQVLVVVDPETVVEMLRKQYAAAAPEAQTEKEEMKEEEETETHDGKQEDQKDEHDRRKRQATFGFGMNRGPYGRNYQANVGYQRRFNSGRSSFGVHGHKNWGASGRSHGFGITFLHRFRR
ncbi:uncharacterized protein LOC135107341 isoform X1 [Scylla paramamosain]|uniref:uncharacterized protein LOC135107341 isoform X1 n=1 Tax=Scylla paramamosain TaxID=85552 RepID=UPI003082746F